MFSSLNCSLINYYSENDLNSIHAIDKEMNFNINKLKYDKALLLYGQSNYITEGDSIFLVNWDLIINGKKKGTMNLGFDKYLKTMSGFRLNFDISLTRKNIFDDFYQKIISFIKKEGGEQLSDKATDEPSENVNTQSKSESYIKDGKKYERRATYYPNGKQESFGIYQDRKKTGIWKYWDNDGNLSSKGSYKEGLQDSIWTYWYPDGSVNMEGTYKNGRKDGIWNYYDDNSNLKKIYFKDNIVEKEIEDSSFERRSTYYPDGKQKSFGIYENRKKTGMWKYWDNEGKLSSKGFYKEGLQDSIWTYWYPDGTLKMYGKYKNGLQDSIWIFWYSDGSLNMDGVYKNGQKDGMWNYYDENSNRKKIFFENDDIKKEFEDSSEIKYKGLQRKFLNENEIINKSLDTAKYLSDFEKQIIREQNELRIKPRKYISILKNMKNYLNGNILRMPGNNPKLTKEGAIPIDEAIDYLEFINPLPPYLPSRDLCLAAKDHVKDHSKNGIVGHVGSDGSSLNVRVKRYCSFNGMIGENIAYGPKTARDIILSLLIDEGVLGRGHRYALLSYDFKFIGVSFGDHSKYGYVCVLDYAYFCEEKIK
jgi:antitoxin component YwqK of YwqJK toxin-antitoxin module